MWLCLSPPSQGPLQRDNKLRFGDGLFSFCSPFRLTPRDEKCPPVLTVQRAVSRSGRGLPGDSLGIAGTELGIILNYWAACSASRLPVHSWIFPPRNEQGLGVSQPLQGLLSPTPDKPFAFSEALSDEAVCPICCYFSLQCSLQPRGTGLCFWFSFPEPPSPSLSLVCAVTSPQCHCASDAILALVLAGDF